jgi:hypothetical protein
VGGHLRGEKNGKKFGMMSNIVLIPAGKNDVIKAIFLLQD